MVDERVKCLDCANIHKMSEDELKFDIHAYGLCHSEGGTKDIDDIMSLRHCSRYRQGGNNLDIQDYPEDQKLFKCLNCAHAVKVPYAFARPTHHENWECPPKGVTKQYEDCEALRCCNKYLKGNPKNKT